MQKFVQVSQKLWNFMAANIFGDMEVQDSVIDEELNIKIKNDSFVSGLANNLLSIRKLETNGL